MIVVRPEPRADRFSWTEGDLVFNKYPAPVESDDADELDPVAPDEPSGAAE